MERNVVALAWVLDNIDKNGIQASGTLEPIPSGTTLIQGARVILYSYLFILKPSSFQTAYSHPTTYSSTSEVAESGHGCEKFPGPRSGFANRNSQFLHTTKK